MRAVFLASAACVLALQLMPGCKDMGSDPPNAPVAAISAVLPDSGRGGDTIRVFGAGFGSVRASSVVRFGSAAALVYPEWSDTAIAAVIPPGLPAGTVALTVTVGGAASDPVAFTLLVAPSSSRSFAADVLPRLELYGCLGCHGGSGGLFLDTQPRVLAGGAHGPAVIPGDAENSLMIKKMSVSPPFGGRMPEGGPYLPDSTVQVIKDWINQGALNN